MRYLTCSIWIVVVVAGCAEDTGPPPRDGYRMERVSYEKRRFQGVDVFRVGAIHLTEAVTAVAAITGPQRIGPSQPLVMEGGDHRGGPRHHGAFRPIGALLRRLQASRQLLGRCQRTGDSAERSVSVSNRLPRPTAQGAASRSAVGHDDDLFGRMGHGRKHCRGRPSRGIAAGCPNPSRKSVDPVRTSLGVRSGHRISKCLSVRRVRRTHARWNCATRSPRSSNQDSQSEGRLMRTRNWDGPSVQAPRSSRENSTTVRAGAAIIIRMRSQPGSSAVA